MEGIGPKRPIIGSERPIFKNLWSKKANSEEGPLFEGKQFKGVNI